MYEPICTCTHVYIFKKMYKRVHRGPPYKGTVGRPVQYKGILVACKGILGVVLVACKGNFPYTGMHRTRVFFGGLPGGFVQGYPLVR